MFRAEVQPFDGLPTAALDAGFRKPWLPVDKYLICQKKSLN